METKQARFKKILEIALNAAILAASLGAITIVVHGRVFSARKYLSGQAVLREGTKIEVPGVDWHNSKVTVVLALSTQCPFCSASASFYRQLKESATASSIRIVAVLPQRTAEARDYLAKLRVPVEYVAQVPLSSIQVHATPTVIFVGSDGKVRHSWIGQLPPSGEKEVMKLLPSAGSNH